MAALCIALIMALGMTMTVSANISETDTGTISVTGAEADVQVTAYRLMDVNYDFAGSNQPVDPVYSWVDEIADWVSDNYSSYIGADNSVQEAFSTADPTAIAAFYDALAAQIRSENITLDSKPATADDNGDADIAELQMGNYLVLVENGLKVYSPSAVNLVPVWNETDKTWEMSTPAVVELKFEELGITKTAGTDDDDLTASIGDTVNYTVTADVPGYPANTLDQNKIFNIYDTLQAGLTLEAGSFQVTGYVGGVEGTATNLTDGNTDNTYYTLTTYRAQDLENQNVSFSIVFDYDALKDGNGTRFDAVQVTYNATVNADAQAFDSSTDPGNLGNTAKLSYGNNPYAESATHKNKTDEAEVYTYGVNISKVDAKNDQTFLPGAEFTISESRDGANPIKFVKTGDGMYRKAVTEDEVAATATLIVGASGDVTGKLALEGLDAGTYYLTETKAPGGYNKLGSLVEITITDTEPNGIVNDGTEAADGADGYTDVTVENSQGLQLPTTGGIGTVIFTACGVLLMGLGAAVIAFVLMRRRRG